MSGDTSIAKAQAAYDRAVAAHGDLAPPSKFGGKTVAATKKPSLSGWTHGEMPGFEYIRPEEVKRMADDMDFEIRGGGAADHAGSEPGFKGKHHASHAEAQHLARNPGQPTGVDRPMCGTCQDLFTHASEYSNQPLLVQDPNGMRLFVDGKVIDNPDPSQFPDAVRVTPEDVKQGAAAGGGAVVVSSEP
jgi:hypothetical protein